MSVTGKAVRSDKLVCGDLEIKKDCMVAELKGSKPMTDERGGRIGTVN